MIAPKTKIIFLLLMILIVQISESQAQKTEADVFKSLALSHMAAGRYGEAIDQLNKYVAVNARDPEGYNLLGICHEKRKQYEWSRLNYRRAIALEEKNQSKRNEYEKNLQRLIGIWYPLLNKRIEGHQREIAINPNRAFDYLEIGNAYRLMEIWDKAEQWYDEYFLPSEYLILLLG